MAPTRRAIPRVLVGFEMPAAVEERAALRREARRVARAAGVGAMELSVLFVDDERMRALNLAYRGFDKTTDVLAFPQEDELFGSSPGPEADDGRPERSGCGASEPRPLGDVVVSVPTARAQAEEYGHSLADEIRRLLVHGTLHLLGHDHLEPAETEAMRAAEAEVISSLERRDAPREARAAKVGGGGAGRKGR